MDRAQEMPEPEMPEPESTESDLGEYEDPMIKLERFVDTDVYNEEDMYEDDMYEEPTDCIITYKEEIQDRFNEWYGYYLGEIEKYIIN